ncbi:hypothetical protein IU500_24685 [Nocardia terpenica]|uniref:hypothetical protein n=1 Tax=Nocardia terpenica TaxID=455432 RepID=UPI0018956893|nr:hypothetical protein [Nocardia terpenica]MBF6064698.1 hypothetical protein [Nocardia terpenica]MBF6107214.1 hypothetical protein [Nocardia terpenica]MBF6114972.1 hypothetical protein [Nocardia terpenica]MBF6122077.1 hypothetical protein [Nocardia terpenica]MBF6154460.1 hypothetical protein [Nocardia terpenica]
MVQEITDSSGRFAESIRAIVDGWRIENPHARSVPRSVRKQINLAVREDNRRQLLDYQRARLDIESAVRDHQHNVLVGYRPRVSETYEMWFARQQQLGQERLAIEQRINADPRLSVEDRGQAVTALSVAHHAPSVPMLPVFTPQPARGLQALRARVQAGLSRLRVGLAGDSERRRLEQWEQVHRAQAEQAQRLPNREAATAVKTAQSLGLGDHGVWISRDTNEHREARVAQLETAAADSAARLSALEAVVAALRTENERVNQAAAAVTAERDQLAAQLNTAGGQQPAANNSESDPSPDAAATNLIAAAHPHVGAPMPACPATEAANGQYATAATSSAGDGLET